jgi:amino acid exporter
LVVIESTLRGGRRSGIFTGLGASTGDGLYALIGLLGFSTLSSQGESLFQALKILGAGYLTFLGIRMWLRRSAVADDLDRHQLPGIWRCFLRGLATDLSNPKTILFFGSVFAVALHRDTPSWVKAAIWSEIVLISVLWRLALCRLFSTPALRAWYAKYSLLVERVFGGVLILLGWRMATGVGRSVPNRWHVPSTVGRSVPDRRRIHP